MTMTEKISIDRPSAFTTLAARHLDQTEGPVQVGRTLTDDDRSAINTVLRYVAKAHNAPSDGPGAPQEAPEGPESVKTRETGAQGPSRPSSASSGEPARFDEEQHRLFGSMTTEAEHSLKAALGMFERCYPEQWPGTFSATVADSMRDTIRNLERARLAVADLHNSERLAEASKRCTCTTSFKPDNQSEVYVNPHCPQHGKDYRP